MLILWTDASLSRDSDNTDPASYAVAARKGSGWTGRFGYSFDTCIDNAEMCAISAALAMAIDEVKQSKAEGNHPGGFGPVVRIYTDSRSSLDKIRAYPQEPWGPGYRRQRFILKTIVDQSRELEDMAQLMLHWVPRNRVDANRVADKIAKNALSVFRTSNKEGSTEGIAAQEARGNGILNKPAVTDNHGALAAFEDSVSEQTAKEDVAGVEHAAQQPRL
jgi:ribonuclease HI